ncbi:MAG: glucose-6-phosphate 1-dehydrogenase [Myxococcota bacterium]|jgi:glucose-6-phosphate 1-dehydrogenase
MDSDLTSQNGGDEPLDMVVVGGGGDLARRKLIPSLYALHRDGLTPANLRIFGVSRSVLSHEQYRNSMEQAVREFSAPGGFVEDSWANFAQCLFHGTADALDADSVAKLNTLFGSSQRPARQIYYLATPPTLYGPICEHLGQAGLITEQSRVVLEKPIGHDLASARAINEKVARYFPEDRVFRIDHYLGKETVQNLMALRFGNALFEPLWRRGRVDHVQITVAETLGVGDRAEYYENSGALRDMVQNHLLQLLCLVAMEPPFSLDPDAVRDEKLKVLRALRPITGEHIRTKSVRGQYGPGAVDGKAVPSYLDEDGVAPNSRVETFVALQADVDNWRWAGVPFYLRTGKRLQQRFSEIIIQFRPLPHIIFDQTNNDISANRLVIRLQPDEGIKLGLMAKQPGRRMSLRPVSLDLNFAETFSGRTLTAYERLLLDVGRADPTLFMRRDEVEAAWGWVEPIIQGWDEQDTKLRSYMSGSWGPSKSISMVERNGHSWSEDAA